MKNYSMTKKFIIIFIACVVGLSIIGGIAVAISSSGSSGKNNQSDVNNNNSNESTLIFPLDENTSKNEEEFLVSLEGSYTDNQAGNALLSVSAPYVGEKGVVITITQSVSATQKKYWNMYVEPNTDLTKLEYTSCLHMIITYDENGNEGEPITVYSDGTGYFSFDKGNLIWHSNVKDEITDIVFTKNARQSN